MTISVRENLPFTEAFVHREDLTDQTADKPAHEYGDFHALNLAM